MNKAKHKKGETVTMTDDAIASRTRCAKQMNAISDPLDTIDSEALTNAIDAALAKQGPLFTDLPQIVSRESLLESYEVAVRLLRSVEKHLDREQYVELASVRHTLALAKPGTFNR